MSLIDGVGDEVTEFFLILTIILIGVGAWWSTAINHRFRIRTVLILEHRRNSTSINSNNQSTSRNTTEQRIRLNPERIPETTYEQGVVNRSELIEQSEEEIEQNNIVQTMDADTNTLRKRRIAYFQESGNGATSSDLARGEPLLESNEHNRIEQIATEEASASTSGDKLLNIAEGHDEEIIKTSTESDLIRIKLKYLNDDIKSVEGKLLEKLGDFKKRHFEVELAACKLVRLIFNGQVLQKDSETLKDCGLFDNCVVHCLVHQRPAGSGSSTSTRNDDTTSSRSYNSNIFNDNTTGAFLNGAGLNSSATSNGSGERDNATLPWDLGNVLLALITLILAVAWYFRFEYAQLFTVTATVFLMCLTGIFTLLLIGLLYPDPTSVQQATNASNNNTTNTTPQSVS